jgi:hypothetical protein
MIEAVSTSETWSTSTKVHGKTTQKVVILKKNYFNYSSTSIRVGEKAVRRLYAKTSKQFPAKQDEAKIMLLICFLFVVLAGKCVRCLIN